MKILNKLKFNYKFQNITDILKLYILVLIVFSVFRFALFLTQIDNVGESTSVLTIFQAFFMGVRFDTVITSYILVLPFILLTIRDLVKPSAKTLNQFVFWFTFILFSLAFIVNGADIPYFEQFFSRFSITAFEWMDSPVFVFKMIFEEPSLWLFIIPIVAFIYLFYRLLKRVFLSESKIPQNIKPIPHILVSILFVGLMFLGMRGRLDEKSPIRVGTAYFSTDPLLNQLGLNPNFTLLKSYLESNKEANKPFNLMPNDIAVKKTQKYLDIHPAAGEFPLLRKENERSDSAQYKNIVIVMMEGMSTAKMGRHGNTHGLTPFLDSLSNEGLYFENAYSAGIHTFNGIFSTLFAYPVSTWNWNSFKEIGLFYSIFYNS